MSDWKKVKIGEIFKIEKGSLQSSKCIPGKYDFITAASEWKTHESYSHECEAIVYAVAASGSLGRAHYVNGKFIASDLCFILTEKDKEKYPINFQFYQLIFELIREEIVSKTKTGTSKESINQKNFSNYEIPYFSFDYQMANYEKLVNTKQKISELLEESEKQKSYAKQLRQNILQEAIEGKLTEEWRKENAVVKGNPDFDAEALFEKIQEEKCHTDSELLRNSKKKVFEPISENEQPFEIPEGWKWVRLGEIIKEPPRNGYSPKAVDFETPIKTLKLGAVTYGIFDPNEYKYINEEIPKDAYCWLKNGDILIERSNSIEYVGICAIYTGKDDEFMYPDLLMRFRTQDILSKQYIHTALISPFNRSYFMNSAKGAQKTMPKINQDCVVNTMIPLPPLAEQREIVSRVEKLLTNVTELENQITERETLTKQMLQSTMKDAFV